LAINYILEKNNLPGVGGGDEWTARSFNNESVGEDAILRAIVEKNQGVSMPEAVSFMNAFHDEVRLNLAAGRNVHTRLASFTESITGKYHEGEEPKVGSVRVNAHVSEELQRAVAEVVPVKSKLERQGPAIESIFDVHSGKMDNTLSPSHDVRIEGRSIKVTGDPTTVGVHFSKLGSDKIYTVAPQSLTVNDPSRLTFELPDNMEPGNYVLTITTTYSQRKKQPQNKDFHTITFPKDLTV
jgi:hypothetical protein